jgi:hypothetical protein
MATYIGGTAVRRGYYIDGRSFGFITVERDGDALPGGPERRWLHVPVLAVIAAAPTLGSLFVMTLPFLGFGLVAWKLASKLAPAAWAGARELSATVAPPLSTGEAYLAGAPPKDAAATPPPPDEKLDAVAADIEAARAAARRDRK